MNPPKKGPVRTAKGVFDAWEKRTELVKLQTNAESAANDAKTIRLKALRLEKEKQDAIEAAAALRFTRSNLRFSLASICL